MANQLQVDVKIKGPLFSARIDDVTKRALVGEVLDKVEERVARQPRSPKAGRKNNTLEAHRRNDGPSVALDVTSTLNYPRTKGTAWLRYNAGMVKSMAPRVIRAAAKRIALDLGGS